MSDIYKKYAELLVQYCLNLKKGERLLVRTTTLAEGFLPFLYTEILKAGAIPEFSISFKSQGVTFYKNASHDQLLKPSEFYDHAIQNFDAVLTIDAPHDVNELKEIDAELKKKRQESLAPIKKQFMTRSADNELKWALCMLPTPSLAQEANMSMDEYEDFIYSACYLKSNNPTEEWMKLGRFQQKIVDYLNKVSDVTFKGPGTSISFSTKGRLWINSDGKRNMPSGEVFTSPVEDSVNGTIYFSYPSRYLGDDVEGVTLTVEDGYITQWTAEVGQHVLDNVFMVPGSRYFGEVAIGTNSQIQTATRNILFDEKIGGSIHMAIGASYPETGGKNESSVHWDLITDMKNGGEIIADGYCIYKNGKFLIN